MIPQLIIIALGLLGLGGHIARHGETKKESKYDAWSFIIYLILYWWILNSGGFFDVLK